jgi:hypothetical protein
MVKLMGDRDGHKNKLGTTKDRICENGRLELAHVSIYSKARRGG